MTEAYRNARHALLAALIPPLVHKLNNQLAVISGHCDVWARDRPGGAGSFAHQVDATRRETRNVSDLVVALSTYAKDLPPRETTVDLAGVARRAAALIEPIASEHGVDLRLAARGVAPVVESDAGRLHQALVTLGAGVAIASGPKGGRADPLRARIAVSAGGGRAVLALVFAGVLDLPFDAVDPPFVRRRLGTRATIYRLALPSHAGVDEPEPVQVRGDDPRRLLLLEPESLLAELVGSVLGESGYRVDVVATVGEAKERLAQGASDLVLFDHDAEAGLPGSLETLLSLRVPLAVLADDSVAVPDTVRVLRKPFRPQELVEFVELCL